MRKFYQGCVVFAGASVGLIGLSIMYVLTIMIFTNPRLPPAPPTGMWVGLLGLYCAGMSAFAYALLSGDWRKWL